MARSRLAIWSAIGSILRTRAQPLQVIHHNFPRRPGLLSVFFSPFRPHRHDGHVERAKDINLPRTELTARKPGPRFKINERNRVGAKTVPRPSGIKLAEPVPKV